MVNKQVCESEGIIWIKLVACDLDGTLLDENHQLSQRNIQAIQRLHKAGINFMVATGRNYQSVAPMFKKEGIHCDCLLLNGALITDALWKTAVSYTDAGNR